jgi:hypothetical protein
MKEIQPVSIWYNGQILQATIFELFSNSDNLIDNANFTYRLYTNDNIVLTSGNINMTGFDYQAYSTSPDSNAYAYQWGATQLNLILV